MANYTLGLLTGQESVVYTQQGKEWTVRKSGDLENTVASFKSHRGFTVATPLENVSITYEELAKALGGMKNAYAELVRAFFEGKDKDELYALYPPEYAQGLARSYPPIPEPFFTLDIFWDMGSTVKTWSGRWIDATMQDNVVHAGDTFGGTIYYPTEKADDEIHITGEELVVMATYLAETEMCAEDRDAGCFAVKHAVG